MTPLAHDLDAMATSDAYNAWLVERASPWLHGRILDIGAGIGTHTTRLAELADTLVALEPDPQFAALLRERTDGVEIIEGDATAVNGLFDAILCFNVLEHIADDEGALNRFRELLAPEGALLLIVPAHPALFGSLDRAFGHERRYTKDGLRGKLLEAGFVVERLQHVNPIGAAAWFVRSKIERRGHLPRARLRLYDRLVPALKLFDSVPVPIGLSLWAVAKTSGTASASARNT